MALQEGMIKRRLFVKIYTIIDITIFSLKNINTTKTKKTVRFYRRKIITEKLYMYKNI